MFIVLDVSAVLLIMSSCVSFQETLGCWRTWAELWCYTEGPSCPTRPTPANAEAPPTRRRCSSTPAWSARTVQKGFCCTAPEHAASHHCTFLAYVKTHFPAMYASFCISMCRLTVKVLSAASPSSLTMLRLEKCSSHSLSTVCVYVTYRPRSSDMSCSRLFYELKFLHPLFVWFASPTGTGPLNVISAIMYSSLWFLFHS